MEREITRSDGILVGPDLGIAGVGAGVGLGDIGPDHVEELDLLILGDLEASIGHAGSGRGCRAPRFWIVQ